MMSRLPHISDELVAEAMLSPMTPSFPVGMP
jgi:hypothetical protein